MTLNDNTTSLEELLDLANSIPPANTYVAKPDEFNFGDIMAFDDNGNAVGLSVLPIDKGGTGATTADDARANLGITPENIGAADASEHNMKTYTDLAQLGLDEGCTVQELFTALPIHSKAYISSSSLNSDSIPSQYGNVEITKVNTSARSSIYFLGKHHVDYRLSANDGTVGTTWYEIYNSGNLTGGVSTIATADLTANRTLISNDDGKVVVSAITSTELGYLDGVTSNLQTQLDNRTKGSTISATTAATAGWYRIAKSNAGIDRCHGIFKINTQANSYHGNAILIATTNFGATNSTNITVLSASHFATVTMSKARIVYHTTYSNNYAYLEIYLSQAVATPIEVELIGGNTGWTLVDPSTAGSIPSGYNNKEVSITNGTMSTPSLATSSTIDAGGLITAAAGIKSGGNIYSDTAVTDNLGTAALPWKNIYGQAYELYRIANTRYGRMYVQTAGTESTVGVGTLTLGNATASGTAENAKGRIYLYGEGEGFTLIAPGNNTASNINLTLPADTGTIALTSATWAASKITAGTMAGKVLANATAVATVTNKQVRNIYAGTAAMTDGTTALTSGDIYLQY